MPEHTATLIFKRWPRWVYALRRFDIIIDGKKVGSIANGKTETIMVSPGQHEVELAVSWIIKSQKQTVEITPGETFLLECGTPLRLWQFMLPLSFFLLVGFKRFIYSLSTSALLIYAGFAILVALFIIVYYIRLFIGRGKFVCLKEPQRQTSEQSQAGP